MTSTIDAVTQRLRDLMRAYPGIGTDVSSGDPLVALPAYEVFATGAVYTQISSIDFFVPRVYVVRVYLQRMPDLATEAESRAASKAVLTALEPLADYLLHAQSLQLGDSGIGVDVTAFRDRGAMRARYGDGNAAATYAGFDLELTVEAVQ